MKEAFVVGSGPNGLTAAIVLQRAGWWTTVFEANPNIGGGARTEALTLPGILHDTCSAIHPMAVSSPAFQSFPLHEHGLEWIHPPIAVAHPLDDGSAAVLLRDLNETCARLCEDGRRYRRAVARLARNWKKLSTDIFRPPVHLPSHPVLLARFGLLAMWPASTIARRIFRTQMGRALFGGIAAHAVMPLDRVGSGAFAWALTIAAHGAGWPMPRGGSQSIANALASYLESLGGRIERNARIDSLDQLDGARIKLLDVTPRQFLKIAGERLPAQYRRKLEAYRYGPAAYKMDFALRGPIPWKAAECARAGTVHVGGTLEEIENSERQPEQGIVPSDPLVLVTQPTLFDASRAPAGHHIAWAYCHVSNGCTVDVSRRIESQIERFAPGFRERILARHIFTPAVLEEHNANNVGGDIMGGAHTLSQLLQRPTSRYYRTPLEGVYLCSSSTPPGGGVHGMCGYNAAMAALSDIR